jgi:SulP family sulfate permease
MFLPKIFSMIKNKNDDFNKEQIAKDIIAGIIVAVIALPLSIALAIASGVSPEKGLITAIIAGFLISLLGGSRVQIGGPTGAFVVIVYGIIEKYGVEGLTIATLMAGVMLVVLGFLRFGSVIKFIPYTITTGFTSGIAIVLFSTQVKDFLGLSMEEVPSEFIPKWNAIFLSLHTIKLETLMVGLASLLIIIFWPKINKKIPGTLIALVVITAIVKLFNIPIDTIGTRFGEISSAIPSPSLVVLNFQMIKDLFAPAFTIAILAGIESLMSAVVADGMIGKKHNSNVELIAQGIANIASCFFGGIPATGAIARTTANIKNGGRTPIAGIIQAIMLLLFILVLMPLAKLIPMATLAAILIMVSYNMSEIKSFKFLLKASKSDISVLLITFTLTIVFDLVIAIEVGMVLAMFLFIKKMSDSTELNNGNLYLEDYLEEKENENLNEKNISLKDKILVFEINGPLFFGAASTFLNIINEINSNADILILRMKNVPIIDATAFDVLNRINEHCRRHHIMLLFSEVNNTPLGIMKKNGFYYKLGSERFLDTFENALKLSNDIIEFKELRV